MLLSISICQNAQLIITAGTHAKANYHKPKLPKADTYLTGCADSLIPVFNCLMALLVLPEGHTK